MRTRAILLHRGLNRALITVAWLVFFGAWLELLFEDHAPGSNIHDYWNSLWWAIVTLTTVGYGDRFPVSVGGRIVAIVVMLMGIGLLGVVTATVASYFVQEHTDAAKQSFADAHDAVTVQLDALGDRMARLEELLLGASAPVTGSTGDGGGAPPDGGPRWDRRSGGDRPGAVGSPGPPRPATTMAPMHATLSRDGQLTDADRASVQQALAGDGFFWLDLDGIDTEASAMLLEDFKLHHLAVEAAGEFGHRPKIEDYDGFTYVVVRGADTGDTGAAEIHVLFSERFLVSVHQGTSSVVSSVRDGLAEHPAAAGSPPQIVLVFRLMEQLVNSFFPLTGGLRRPDRQPRGRDPGQAHRRAAGHALRHEADPHPDPQAGRPPAGHAGQCDLGDHPRARSHRRGRAVLPESLRPPDPHQRPGGQLPRPAERHHGHAPVRGVEPPERGDEAADHHRHHLPAAVVPHRASSDRTSAGWWST